MKVSLCSSGLTVVIEDRSGFQPSTRVRIPDWDALLLVYATMFVPVLFSLMIGANIFVWDKLRINHVFIFGERGTTSTAGESLTSRVVELDTASKIEYQEYAEVRRPRELSMFLLTFHDKIPTILLSTLCFSFWLSFSSIASHAVHPQTWPLIWLGFNTLMLCNPLPVYHRSSRIWLLKKFISLIVSGTKRVGVRVQYALLGVTSTHHIPLSSQSSGWRSSSLPTDLPPTLTF
jgi:hypothetical protein